MTTSSLQSPARASLIMKSISRATKALSSAVALRVSAPWFTITRRSSPGSPNKALRPLTTLEARMRLGPMGFLSRILQHIRRRAMLRHIRRNERAFVRRAETNPWIHEYRRVKAEAERTGDDSLFADFQRRFKRAEAERYSCSR
jgi:hypothetical protein